MAKVTVREFFSCLWWAIVNMPEAEREYHMKKNTCRKCGYNKGKDWYGGPR